MCLPGLRPRWQSKEDEWHLLHSVWGCLKLARDQVRKIGFHVAAKHNLSRYKHLVNNGLGQFRFVFNLADFHYNNNSSKLLHFFRCYL